LQYKVLLKHMQMDKQNEHLENLSQIRSLMERSSRFISLSGLSGVAAGIFAIIGAAAAYFYLGKHTYSSSARPYYEYAYSESGDPDAHFCLFFLMDGILILIASLTTVLILTTRKAKQKGQSIWDPIAKRLLINLMIPLVAGGLFCLILMYHGLVALIAPTTLIFYGLALLNASKYTLDDIRYLGICEIGLGLISSMYIGYGLIFWTIGFGVLHIVYGTLMYKKYEK
jgi:hypothetical protein